MKHTLLRLFYLPVALLLLSSAVTVLGQQKEPSNDNQLPKKSDLMLVVGPDSSPLAGGSADFRHVEFSFEKLVKGAPYSAQAVTQATQTLSDGNRITSESSSVVYRDSKGRTRREILGAGASAGTQPERITINDPATGDAFDLDPATRTASSNRVMRLAATLETVRAQTGAAGPGGFGEIAVSADTAPAQLQNFGFVRVAPGGVKLATPEDKPPLPRNESLGTQTIEGVEAQGSRTTITIPAGKIGNERPIEMVTETWFSPELHTMVLRKHSDPRMGESTYRLTDIKRNEPDASLFQPPAGAKLRSEPVIELHREKAPSKE